MQWLIVFVLLIHPGQSSRGSVSPNIVHGETEPDLNFPEPGLSEVAPFTWQLRDVIICEKLCTELNQNTAKALFPICSSCRNIQFDRFYFLRKSSRRRPCFLWCYARGVRVGKLNAVVVLCSCVPGYKSQKQKGESGKLLIKLKRRWMVKISCHSR